MGAFSKRPPNRCNVLMIRAQTRRDPSTGEKLTPWGTWTA